MSNSKLVACAAVALALGLGCNSRPSAPEASEKAAPAAALAELSVPQVAAALKDKSAVVVDANNPETREKFGVVPGAVLLSDHRSYALTELPRDKAQPLVFYCGGTQCRASDAAASRAASAGYAKVSVMRDGIKGWVAAGQATTSAPKS
ncbi:MAG: rhodanese-like domain-containing protein [Myxococcales bacterium]